MNRRKEPDFTMVYACGGDCAAPLDATVIAAVADAGFDGIHLPIRDKGPIRTDASEEELRRIAAEAASAGLIRVVSCHQDNLTDITTADLTRRASAIEAVVSLLDRAAWLGASTLVIEPRSGRADAANPLNDTYDDILARALGALLALRFEAELRGVVLCCRVIANGLLRSPIEARHFVDRLSLPFVGLAIDGAEDTACDLGEYICMLTHRISHVSIANRDFGSDSAKDAAPSANDIHIVRALREIGYEGCLTTRVGSTPSEAMDYLRSVMSAAE